MDRPEKDEIQNWLRHPAGQWFLSELERQNEINLVKLLNADSAPDLYRAQQEARLLKIIREMLDG